MESVDYGGYQSGGSCNNQCTVKGTSIEMADGTHKLIEKIRVGDVLKGMKISDAPEDDTIVGWSTDILNLIETEVVVMGILPFFSQRIHNFNNGLIETSESHAHFIKRGDDWSFKQARNIQVGDFLVDKDGNSIEITSIDVSQGEDRKRKDFQYRFERPYSINLSLLDRFVNEGQRREALPERLLLAAICIDALGVVVGQQPQLLLVMRLLGVVLAILDPQPWQHFAPLDVLPHFLIRADSLRFTSAKRLRWQERQGLFARPKDEPDAKNHHRLHRFGIELVHGPHPARQVARFVSPFPNLSQDVIRCAAIRGRIYRRPRSAIDEGRGGCDLGALGTRGTLWRFREPARRHFCSPLC
jgi:hypothetical protein